LGGIGQPSANHTISKIQGGGRKNTRASSSQERKGDHPIKEGKTNIEQNKGFWRAFNALWYTEGEKKNAEKQE